MQLPESESRALIYRAFTWEIERELGSGNGAFDLEGELAKPPMRGFDSERQMVLQRQSGVTVVEIEPPLWHLRHGERKQPLNEWHLGALAGYILPDAFWASRETNDYRPGTCGHGRLT